MECAARMDLNSSIIFFKSVREADTATPHFSLLSPPSYILLPPFSFAQNTMGFGRNLYNLTKFVKTLWEGLTFGRKSGILYLALGETEC